MPQTALLSVVTNVKAKATAQLSVHTNVTTSRVDSLSANTTVTRVLAQILSEGWRIIGAKVEMDLGDGGFTEIPRTELGSSLRVSSSFDGFTDEVSFQLHGRKYSPFKSALIRGQQRVRITGILGKPGSVTTRKLFEGAVAAGQFFGDPPFATISAIDSFGKHASKLVHYNLDPGSRRTRLSVLLEILATYGIQVGEINLGPGEGGILLKPVSVSAVGLGEFLRDFLKPTGAVYWWDQTTQTFHAIKIRPASVPHRTLTASSMGPELEVVVPATNNANNVTATGILFAYTGPSGERTERTQDVSRAVYAPLVATKRQNKADGSLTTLSLTSAAVDREVGKVIKWSNYRGGNLVSEVTEEWGWYAPMAAPKKQLSNGTVQHNPDRDVYLYADGSWRSADREEYQVIRRTRLIKYYDTEGYLTQRYDFRESFMARRQAITQTVDGVNETFLVTYMTEDGIGWFSDVEKLDRPEYSITNVNGDELRLLAGEVTDIYGPFAYPVQKQANSYGYGPTSAKTFKNVSIEADQWIGRVVTSYRALTEEQYTVTTYRSSVIGTTGGGSVPIIGGTSVDPIRTVTGTRPPVEQLTDFQSAQQARSTAVDNVQVALNESHYYYIHDEWAETNGELQVIAFEELRAQGKWPLRFPMPVDFDIRKGHTIRINRPEHGLNNEDMLAWTVDTEIDLKTGASRQAMVVDYFPPELRN
jgi:hypothetical protein